MRWKTGMLVLIGLATSLPAHAVDGEEVVRGLYENARLLLRQGRPDEALKDLERIYTSHADSEYADEALYELGNYFLGNGKYQAAMDSFNKLISDFGDRNMAPRAYFKIGQIYEDLAFPGFDMEKADANFTRVSNIYARSDLVDDALLHSGLIKAKLQEFRNARSTFQRLVDEFPRSELAPQALYHLGLTLIYLGEPIQAMELLQKTIDEYDNEDVSLRALRVINNLYRTSIRIPTGHKKLYRVDASFSSKQFKKVVALAVDRDDNLYVAKDGSSLVKVFSSAGTPLPPIAGQKEVRDLCVDGAGTLYVVKKKSVYFEGKELIFKKKTSKGLQKLEKLVSLVRSAERHFYVQVEKADSLIRFDKEANFIREFPNFRFNGIKDLTIDPRGFLYLIDGKLNRLTRIDSNGGRAANIDKTGPKYSLKRMSRVAVDLTGTIYLLDEKEKQVAVFSPDLNLITVFKPPGLNKPEEIAVDSAGIIYIFDRKENVIRKYY